MSRKRALSGHTSDARPTPSGLVRASAFLAVAFVATLGLGAGTIASAATPGVTVSIEDIGDSRPADGGWWVDDDAAATGTATVTTDSFDSSFAAKLTLPSSSAKVYFYHDYPAIDRPVDLVAALAGASYTYTGVNVNFQVELVFLPNDVSSYGAQGSTPCTSAVTWGLSDNPDACYTVMKWEPFTHQTGWQTIDLTQDVAANSTTQTGGWISQKRLGSYAGPGAFIGRTLSTYLAEIDSLEITSMVFGTGSGTTGPTAGWVKDVTFDGVTYTFEQVAAPPAPPLATDTDGLANLIEDQGLDVEADTSNFQATGANDDLSSIDANLPLSGVFVWAGQADAFVDVYAYSTAVFVGSFPVINGNVVLTNVDLSHLLPGDHHLVFQGQTSGALAVIGVTVAEAPGELARTGSDIRLVALGGCAFALVLVGLVLVRRMKKTT
jgi:hypothetical protein